MLVLDAQTSGGMLITVKPEDSDSMIKELKESGYSESCVVGEIVERGEKSVYIK
jgi:selenide,water dikinase